MCKLFPPFTSKSWPDDLSASQATVKLSMSLILSCVQGAVFGCIAFFGKEEQI